MTAGTDITHPGGVCGGLVRVPICEDLALAVKDVALGGAVAGGVLGAALVAHAVAAAATDTTHHTGA
jgi:hypothetical protein